MLLVIDTGNTNTTLGVYDGAELVTHWRLTTARVRTVDEYGVYARNLFEFAGIDFKAFNAIDAQSRYLGGVITPGINISAEALFQRAARLPPVEIKRPPVIIGSSTVGSMQSGLYYGFVGLVDGILKRMLEELGP